MASATTFSRSGSGRNSQPAWHILGPYLRQWGSTEAQLKGRLEGNRTCSSDALHCVCPPRLFPHRSWSGMACLRSHHSDVKRTFRGRCTVWFLPRDGMNRECLQLGRQQSIKAVQSQLRFPNVRDHIHCRSVGIFGNTVARWWLRSRTCWTRATRRAGSMRCFWASGISPSAQRVDCGAPPFLRYASRVVCGPWTHRPAAGESSRTQARRAMTQRVGGFCSPRTRRTPSEANKFGRRVEIGTRRRHGRPVVAHVRS